MAEITLGSIAFALLEVDTRSRFRVLSVSIEMPSFCTSRPSQLTAAVLKCHFGHFQGMVESLDGDLNRSSQVSKEGWIVSRGFVEIVARNAGQESSAMSKESAGGVYEQR